MKKDVGLHGPFGLGPWSLEPDGKTWVDRDTGLTCHVQRHPSLGHLCGYVDIPWELHEAGFSEEEYNDVGIHGGITYAAQKNEQRVYRYGFDCGHRGDLSPGLNVRKEHEPLFRDEKYRTIEYVEAECRELARQLKEMMK